MILEPKNKKSHSLIFCIFLYLILCSHAHPRAFLETNHNFPNFFLIFHIKIQEAE